MSEFPTGAAILDQNRQGLIGKAVDRVDGQSKVTGEARYSYEIQEAGHAAYGYIVGATIAHGQVSAVDRAAALASPGVLLVLTHEDMPPQGEFGSPKEAPSPLAQAKPVMRGPEVRFWGDPVAFVVADTFENARAAAALVRVTYEETPAALVMEDGEIVASTSPTATSRVGDFEAAFAAAEVQLYETYHTPIHSHAQMEPHAATAVWEDDELTIFSASQLLMAARASVAFTLMMDPKKVRIVSRYVGGGFGGKLHVDAAAILAAVAAKALGQPVKAALTRQQMFAVSSHRPASEQRIRLGATPDGVLTAIGHEGIMHQARHRDFTEPVAAATRSLYAASNRMTLHRVVKLDIPMADAVRAPGEAIGMLAVEVAMDEMAEKVGLDPIAFRILNEPKVDPETGKPYGSRSMVSCMEEGAKRFGWNRRAAPGQVRDGRWLVGLGMSGAIRSNYLMGARASLALNVEGHATVRQAMTDIGTGTYTILAQVAAEALGIAVEDVNVEIGDTRFPPAPGSGGSFGAAAASGAILDAAMNLRADVARLAVGDPASPLFGGEAEDVVFAESAVFIGNRSEKLSTLFARSAPDGLTADGKIDPTKEYNDYSQHAHGAHFAEVGIDPLTGEVRLRRMLGVFAAGRILNAKTARSQVLGGMIWGVGSTLMEENFIDPRFGSLSAQDLAAYHVPSHADIVDLDAIFIGEEDDHGNPMKIKGVGELGICGAGASVANAIYNACGVRLRDYPMTLEKVLEGLDALG
jgi:xanthine dehydrogenase YagR molybdenum-binding subunit